MKSHYPKYKIGELDELEKTLSHKNKKILDDFYNFLKINAGEKKALKNKKHMLQVYDIVEKDLDELTKKDIDSFLIVLNQSKRSVWTKNEIKVYLRKFIKKFYNDLNLIENIKLDSRRDLNPQKINENNLVTEEEIEKMLRFAESYKEKAFLFLAFQTGARPQELINLRWRDIKFEDNYADVTLYSNKTGKSRTFPVTKAKEHLWNWKQNYSFVNVQPNDYVFVSRWREKPMTSPGLNKILRRLASRAAINKDVWNYLLRHSQATRLYEELPTPLVEKLMGHKNMSHVYAHISNKKAREVMLEKIYKIEKLNPQDKKELKEMKKELDSLKESMKKQSKQAALTQVQNMILFKFATGEINKKELKEELQILNESYEIINPKIED